LVLYRRVVGSGGRVASNCPQPEETTETGTGAAMAVDGEEGPSLEGIANDMAQKLEGGRRDQGAMKQRKQEKEEKAKKTERRQRRKREEIGRSIKAWIAKAKRYR
jgi:hypothetical protein